MAYFSMQQIQSTKEMKQTLGTFKGVDYSHSKVEVMNNRATDIGNFLIKNGGLRKRNGYSQYAKFDDRINGYWEFNDSEGNIHRIVHSGDKIFSMVLGEKFTENEYTQLEISYKPQYISDEDWNPYVANVIKDQRSYGIVRDNRLYILCGAYLVYGKWNNNWELRCVRDNIDTFIPTTSTNIRNDGSRAVLDEVNIMTLRRKNKFICDEYKPFIEINDSRNIYPEFFENNAYWYDVQYKRAYRFDLSNDNNPYFAVKEMFTNLNGVHLCNQINGATTVICESFNEYFNINSDYYPRFEARETYSNEGKLLEVIIAIENTTENIVSVSSYNRIKLDTSNISNVIVRDLETNNEISNSQYIVDEVNGEIEFFGVSSLNIMNAPSVEVEFTSNQALIDKKYEWIDKCKFGIMFGLNDAECLFVSGNSAMPNYDFHSSIAFSEQQGEISSYENLTYFSDLSYAKLGSSSNEITGYSLLEDTILAIHKKSSFNDSGLYIRSVNLGDAVDSSGAKVYLQDGITPAQTLIFPQYSSSIGKGCVSPHSIENLLGDKLMASNDGIYGIELSQSIKTNERYAKQRSSLINEKLKEEDLENSAAIVYEGKYFLSVGGKNKKVYVADSRFRVYDDLDLRDTFSYEWFVLENIDARIWHINNDNELCFGDSEGRICKFVKDSFEDITYERIECTPYNVEDYLTLEDGKYKEGDTIAFSNDSNLYAIIGNEISYSGINNVINCGSEMYDNYIRYLVGKEVHILSDDVISTGYIVENNYDEDDNIIANTFKLRIVNSDSYINSLELLSNDLKLITPIYKGELAIINDYVYLKGFNEFEKLDIYTNAISVHAFIMHKNPVVAYWFTPALTLGAIDYSKTIKNITLLFEPTNNGELKLGYKIRKNSMTTAKVSNDDISFNGFNAEGIDIFNYWSNFEFEHTSFDLDSIAKSYTIKLKVKDFNIIQFFFISDNNSDCCVNALQINYVLCKKNRGVK